MACMRRNGYVNIRNLILLVFGLLLTGVFYIRYGSIIKPLVFTAVILSLSLLYSLLFNKSNTDERPAFMEDSFTYIRKDDIERIAERINKLIRSIKSRSRENERLTIVARFMSELDEFEDAVPELAANYKKSFAYAQRSASIEQELDELERKAVKAKGSARQIYEKALNEKRLTLHEIQNIKSSLDESESRLHYILSTLQKIEAIVEAAGLNDELSDDDMESLNTHLETFSESLKDVISSMKL